MAKTDPLTTPPKIPKRLAKRMNKIDREFGISKANPLRGNWITSSIQKGPMKDSRYVVEIVCRDLAEMNATQDFLVKVRDER